MKRLQIMIDEGTSKAALIRRFMREHVRPLPARHEREYSFVGATSFALMRLLKVRRALALDGDFAAAGFTELRP